ncbi:MAG: hypothetical protein IPI49_32725 [Myxococcales bacterium]|nr:hypothetical protein [Myxococcales bacterium]
MQVRVGLIVWGITGLLCASAPVALAQRGGKAQPETAEAVAKERATALLAQGNGKLDQGLYVEALALFEQAFHVPQPQAPLQSGADLV